MVKPKVGILSMQRVINYGSFLQAYALKELLKKNGAGEVYFLDIVPGRILVDDSIANKSSVLRYAKKIWQLTKKGKLVTGIKTFFFHKKLTKSIISAWPYLDFESKPVYPLDLVVIGSDEVFNCCQDVTWGYSTQLFGDISNSVARKVVSYAGSFGYTDMEKLRNYGIETEISQNLKKLDSISVRDENSATIVRNLTGCDPMIHLDPVLVYGYKNEIATFNKSPMKKPYMIVYSYQDRINDSGEINAIRQYSKNNNLKLISVFCRYDWCEEAVVPDTPIDVLRWFKYADCIVTDTFHGTIFSIITQSRFVSLIRSSNQNKLRHLLEILNLSDREVDYSLLNQIMSCDPNYSDCNLIIEKYRQATSAYLIGCLK